MELRTMQLKTLQVQIEDEIAVVTINNPPVNSINLQLVEDLDEIFIAFGRMEELRCVVLASGSEKVFLAGYDINLFVGWDREIGMEEARRGHVMLSKIERLEQPVICAINGIAFGGGLELALACDIRVMDEGAKVGLPETGLGIIPGYGGTQRLPRLVGPGMAKKMILTAAPITAGEACRIGLVEELSEAGQCLETAMKLAKSISKQAPLAVAAGKKCVDFAMEHSLREGLKYELSTLGELAESEDKKEGVSAFLEKRTADFRNQ